MKTLEEIKTILAYHKEELREKFKVKEIGIFGSYVKGEQKKNSDIDMIIGFENEESIRGFKYIGLMNELEEYLKNTLHIKPHLASKRHASSSDKWKFIKDELIYVKISE